MKGLNWMIVAAVCVLGVFTAVGCNTVRGAGKDIQKGGKAVEHSADNVQQDIKDQRHHQHTISASAASGGAISPRGSVPVNYQSNKTFTISAHRGYHVADVQVDGKSIGVVDQHTFNEVTEGHTISATFAANRPR